MYADALPFNVMEYGAFGAILLAFVLLIWRGIPAFKVWLDGLIKTHKESLDGILADSAKNREAFQETLKLQRHDAQGIAADAMAKVAIAYERIGRLAERHGDEGKLGE